jgi:hypothetical protein
VRAGALPASAVLRTASSQLVAAQRAVSASAQPFVRDLASVPTTSRAAASSNVAVGPAPAQAKCSACGKSAVPPEARVSQVGDPLEREADAIAERVMLDEPVPLATAAPVGRIHRRCAACEKDENRADETLHAKRSASPETITSEAVGFAQGVASRGGQALSDETRAFFEPRFGRNLAHVRVHSDAEGTRAAQAVRARAYTLGSHIVFGGGEYAPFAPAGRQLLAHELAHVAQQDGGAGRSIQRAPCRSAAQCATAFPGDTGRFVDKVVGQQAAIQSAVQSAPPGSPNAALLARHKAPATELTTLVGSRGVTLPAEVHGIFINAFLGATVGAQTNDCSAFPNGAPAGAPAAKKCIQVPTQMEDDAKTLRAKPALSAADTVQVGELASTIVHEAQHAHFNANAAAVVPAAADCNLGTLVFHGPASGFNFNVDFYLSEMSAIIAEFAPIFKNSQSAPSTTTNNALFAEERAAALDTDESLSGILKALQCVCSCATIDTFTEKVFADATSSWSAPQRDAFQKAMTRIIPAVWPKKLHKT